MVGMRGAYQSRNVRLAVLAAEILTRELGLAIDATSIERGVRHWNWPGRCELVVLPDGRHLLLDAAHNEEGIASLGAELASGWPGDPVGTVAPWRLVFGALDDKPAAAMLSAIAATAAGVILTRPPSPRGVDPRELQSALRDRETAVAEDPRDALDLALAPGCDRVVVCGSIYLVGFVRRELRRRFGVPAPATAAWTAADDRVRT
jgi:folylpolyglutamate synthase/dihydropteroate synthase